MASAKAPLNAKVKELQRRLDDSESIMANQLAEALAPWEGKVVKLEGDLQGAQAQIKQKETSLSNLNREMKQLNRDLASLANENSGLTETVAQLKEAKKNSRRRPSC